MSLILRCHDPGLHHFNQSPQRQLLFHETQRAHQYSPLEYHPLPHLPLVIREGQMLDKFLMLFLTRQMLMQLEPASHRRR